MIEITIKDHSLKLYGSIKELPIWLSKTMNRYLLQDAGIGNSMQDIDAHLEKLQLLISKDRKDESIEEAKNLRFNLFSMLSEWNYKSLGFGCLIAEVDGQPMKDYSPEHLAKTIDRLHISEVEIDDYLQEIKKNLIQSVDLASLNTSPQT